VRMFGAVFWFFPFDNLIGAGVGRTPEDFCANFFHFFFRCVRLLTPTRHFLLLFFMALHLPGVLGGVFLF